MAKNIVICCDGTGNQFGDQNSNVVKAFSVLCKDIPEQILYYHPGVGTKGSMDRPTLFGQLKQKINKMHGVIYGYGVIDNVVHAYRFLMENFEAGDKIYLFGFSRGAYVVRVLCAMLYHFGILEKGNRVLIEYAVSLFLDSSVINAKITHNFKQTFGRECSPHFVGVWDTVSSVGWFYDPLHLAFTKENPGIRIGRQAIALDERRVYYGTNLWQQAEEDQDLKQVWFPGAHSDVGGGYPIEESGLASVSLEWMLAEAKDAGLLIEPDWVKHFFIENPPDPNATLHQSLHGLWWVPEFIPRNHVVREGDVYQKRIGTHGARSRTVPEGSLIHQSVFDRMKDPRNHYHPGNLPQKYQIEPRRQLTEAPASETGLPPPEDQ